MPSLSSGSSATLIVGDGGTASFASNGGFVRVTVTPSGGSASASLFGPAPTRAGFGPYAEGATITISNETAGSCVYESSGGTAAATWATSGSGYALQSPDGGVQALTAVWTPTSFTATGTVLTGVYDFAGIKVRAVSGTVNLTLYDATSATGTAIDTLSAVSLTGGPGSNGYYPTLSSNAARRLATGLHVVVSGGGTITADVLSGS